MNRNTLAQNSPLKERGGSFLLRSHKLSQYMLKCNIVHKKIHITTPNL